MDANNSMKRVNGFGHSDERTFASDYHIPPWKVDIFKDDVETRPGTSLTSPDETICTKNWTVANTVSEGTVEVFHQTGGFILACRHGIIETFAEMRNSGELWVLMQNFLYTYCVIWCRAKYGLATLNEILDVFGPNQAAGYDIGCSHKVTVNASSLGEKARALSLQLVVDAFHGHAHNRLCQLRNHPLFQQGFGLKDLATCERIFAGTNPATRLIRHASYFHWLQFLDLQMNQWDNDKYLELSELIFRYSSIHILLM
jgi:hypothetical protein